MAGNFTALPVALLLMKNTYGVIKEQAPIAIVMTDPYWIHVFLGILMAYSLDANFIN